MSKEELKAQKAKEFWDYYAPTQTGLTATEIEWLKEDDCWLPKGMQAQTL